MKIKSLYIKWILMFTGLIVIAQTFTLLMVVKFILPSVQDGLSTRLYRKAEFLREMHDQGMEITERTLEQTGDADIYFYLFDIKTVPESIGVKHSDITLDMLNRALGGEIVTSSMQGTMAPSFCLFAVGNKIAVLTPNLAGNELTVFVGGISRSVMLGAIIGSVLIVIALIVVIKPIKKVSQATKEVAGGNFDIELHTKSIDEVGQLIQNFNSMTKALQKNEYLKKDFVSSVSHEFKTPITSIEGFAKLLKNGGLSGDEFNEYTDIIIKETARLSNLSSSLLKLSLLDASEFEPARNKFFLDEQIREAVLMLEDKWDKKHIEFEITMDDLPFCGSEELLLQVWINLIHNAIKYSPVRGKIQIEAKTEERNTVISIADQGIGIAPEHADKIFDRFYKADKSRSKEGSGLGLSIVKRILEMSGGTVCVDRQRARGACFVVTLPAGKPVTGNTARNNAD